MARTLAPFRKQALAYPEAWEDHPWGETAFKVRQKIFCFLAEEEDRIRLSFKLPAAGPFALSLPFTAPTAYGLGKSGWVSCTFPKGGQLPLPLLLDWLDESYRAVAPKALVKTLE